MAEAAAQVADDGLAELDQRAAQAPVAHQRAGEDEVGHRQQAEVVEDGEHPLHEQRRREVGQDEDAGEPDAADGEDDRDAGEHRHEQRREQRDERHGGASVAASRAPASRRTAVSAMYAPPSRMPA